MHQDDNRRDKASAFWRYLGRRLKAIAAAVLITIAIVYGESWAIQRAPLLPTSALMALQPAAGCLPADSADALPVAILH